MLLDAQVLIIGAGPSGIGLGIQLIRQFGLRDFHIVEKSTDVGGTWFSNVYPGCGCDVPSHFYSFSFAPKTDWSQVFAMQPEIRDYFRKIADDYDIPSRVSFASQVQSARWDDTTATWIVEIEDLETHHRHLKRCKILISAIGALSVPKKCDLPGEHQFKGPLFHSAEWDHGFDWRGKNVVTIGNGCSATQFVPVISNGPTAVAKITQFARQAHWLSERPNPEYSALFKWTMKWVPGALRSYRALLYWRQERMFSGFHVSRGLKERQAWTNEATQYIRKHAPPKYVDALVPKTVIGCKRRVNDTDYLACLHQNNVELVYDDPISEIVETGVRTKSGRLVAADAIILATGFETQKLLQSIDIRGENGVTLPEYWDEVSQGTCSAYFGTCLSSFPNFFMMMGPNTVTGHLSVIYTVECQINFTMRVIEPLIRSMQPPRIFFPRLRLPLDKVVVSAKAQVEDNIWIQAKAKELVWATGCISWFIDPKTGRNTQMYPDWQWKFWARSIFIPWQDLVYGQSKSLKDQERHRPQGVGLTLGRSLMLIACCVLASTCLVPVENKEAILTTLWNQTVWSKTLSLLK